MNQNQDLDSNKNHDLDEDLPDDDPLVEMLCAYQQHLDQTGTVEVHLEDTSEAIPEMSPEVTDYQRLLDFLHEARSEDGAPPPSAEAIPSVSSYFQHEHLGRFQIVEQLGFGGFGIVFRGIDPIVGRDVAIKVPRPEFLESPELIGRFAREASLVAQLDHPNIVSVYESDCHKIVPYIVMQFLPGKTLTEWRAERGDVPPNESARILRDLASAVAHAHERGVLHRDLKPGNVLVCPRKSKGANAPTISTPILTDFGIASCVGVDSGNTGLGTILGTTDYMSPEQASGRTRDITMQTDVYGLGAILYELLTGRPPFHAANNEQTIQLILHAELPTVRSLNPETPLDLDVICMKCLEKLPADRYSTARDLESDLQRFLDGEPILARPMSSVARLRRWIRRHPVLLGVMITCLIALTGMLILSYWYNVNLAALLKNAEIERAIARQNELTAVSRAYNSDMKMAKTFRDNGNLSQMLHILVRYHKEGVENFRDFAWWYLWREFFESSKILRESKTNFTSVAVTSAGDLAAASCTDGLIYIWSLPDCRLVTTLEGHEFGSVECVCFSPDGNRLISAGEDGTIRFWDSKTFQQVFACTDHKSYVYDVVYSPDGKLLASAGADRSIRIWNAENGEQLGTLLGHTARVACLSFHPTKPILASGGRDGKVGLWDLNTMTHDPRLEDSFLQTHERDLTPSTIAFAPDGNSLVVGTRKSQALLYDMQDENFGKEIGRRTFKCNPLNICWTKQNRMIVAMADSTILVSDGFSRELSSDTAYGHRSVTTSVATPADGTFMVSCSFDGTVRYWPEFLTRQRILIPDDETSKSAADCHLRAVQFSDEFLVADNQRQQLSVYRLPERTLERTFPHENEGDFAISPSGALLLTRQSDGLVTCFQVHDGRTLWTQHVEARPKISRRGTVAIDQSEKVVAATSGRELLIFSTIDSKLVHRLIHPNSLHRILFLEQPGQDPTIISTGDDQVMRFWDVRTGHLLKEYVISSSLNFSMSISKDQSLLALVIGGNFPGVQVWRLADMSEAAFIPVPGETGPDAFNDVQVAFLTKSIFLVHSSTGVTLWDVDREIEMMSFPEFKGSGACGVSADGNQIAVPQRGTIRILNGGPRN